MIRLLLLFLVAQCACAAEDPDKSLNDIINEIFGISDNDDNIRDPLEDNAGCTNQIIGNAGSCHECYFCNDTILQKHVKTKKIQLTLLNSKCDETTGQTVCCIPQQDLIVIRSGDACGKSNPDGKPRKRRTAPRAVLQGEYPWRAWVYKKGTSLPLCAATYVAEDRDQRPALLTLASCVQGLSAEGLEVSFVRGGSRSALVKVTVNPNYTSGKDANNIAILTLLTVESTPKWISPACLPSAKPSHAAPCITTSDEDIRLNTVIPIRKACKNKNEALSDSVTCAVAPPDDYTPEKAAGLFCQEQYVTTPHYILNGLALAKQDDSVASYVNVWHFMQWINNELGLTANQ